MASIKYVPMEEQGVRFVVVAVEDYVVSNEPQSEVVSRDLAGYFNQPVVLVGRSSGRLFGRNDLVAYMSRLQIETLVWETLDV